jgi:hypothetical protein
VAGGDISVAMAGKIQVTAAQLLPSHTAAGCTCLPASTTATTLALLDRPAFSRMQSASAKPGRPNAPAGDRHEPQRARHARVNLVCRQGVLADLSAAEQMVHELQVGRLLA